MATTINDIRKLNNPQRAYEFEVEISGYQEAAGVKFDILTQRVESMSIPETSVETIEINFKGRKQIFPGRDASPHTLTVNFYDDEKRSVYALMKNWINGALDETLGGGLTRDQISATMVVRLFEVGTEGNANVGSSHRFDKLYPTSVGEVSLDYSSSDHAKVAVTFSYDKHIFQTADQKV